MRVMRCFCWLLAPCASCGRLAVCLPACLFVCSGPVSEGRPGRHSAILNVTALRPTLVWSSVLLLLCSSARRVYNPARALDLISFLLLSFALLHHDFSLLILTGWLLRNRSRSLSHSLVDLLPVRLSHSLDSRVVLTITAPIKISPPSARSRLIALPCSIDLVYQPVHAPPSHVLGVPISCHLLTSTSSKHLATARLPLAGFD